MTTYRTLHLMRRDGKTVAAGTVVQIDEAEGAELLALGAIEPAPGAEPDAEPDAAPGAKTDAAPEKASKKKPAERLDPAGG